MFDPYHKWLGIPKEQQPPTHYQILGISPDEQDPEVIEHAALMRMRTLRQYQAGPHASQCTELLNCVARARDTLLDPRKRARYDDRLGRELAGDGAPAPSPRSLRTWPLAALAALVVVGVVAWWASRPAPDDSGALDQTAQATDVEPKAPALPDQPSTPPPAPPVAPPSGPSKPPPPEAKGPEPKTDPAPPAAPAKSPPNKPSPDPQRQSVRILSVSISPDSQRFLASRSDLVVELGDLASMRAVRQWRGTEPGDVVHASAFSPDGKLVAMGGGRLRLWDVASWQPIRDLAGHKDRVTAVDFAPDGPRLLSGSADGTMIEWDVGGSVRKTFLVRSPVTAVRYSPEAGRAFSGDAAGVVQLWDTQDGRPLVSYPFRQSPVSSISVARDGSQVAACYLDPFVYLVNLRRGGLRQVATSAAVRHVAFLPDGNRLVAGDKEGLRLWDLIAPRILASHPRSGGEAESLAVSGDGRLALAGEEGPKLAWWQLPEPPADMVAAVPATNEPAPEPAAPIEKAAVPDPALTKQALDAIRDLFADEYRSRDDQERLALAKRLLRTGRDAQEPTERYVLLTEARDISADAGQTTVAFEAVAALDQWYRIDRAEQKDEILKVVAKKARSNEANEALARAYFEVISDSVAADDYERANDLMRRLLALSKRIKDKDLRQRADEQSRFLRDLRKQYEGLGGTLATLETKPDDPAANLVYGAFLCFWKADWARGLPRLATGSEAKLRELAQAELAGPEAPDALLRLADQWWEVGESRRGQEQTEIRRHAAYWYREVLPELSGVTKLRVQKRWNEAPEPPPSKVASAGRRQKLVSRSEGLGTPAREGSTETEAALSAWQVIGPFGLGSADRAWGTDLPVETQPIDLNAEYGSRAGSLRWTAAARREDGLILLPGPAGQTQEAGQVHYAACWVQVPRVPEAGYCTLRFDGGYKIWINRRFLRGSYDSRTSTGPLAHLAAGWNEVLMKLAPRAGEQGFSLTLSQSGDPLAEDPVAAQVSATPPPAP